LDLRRDPSVAGHECRGAAADVTSIGGKAGMISPMEAADYCYIELYLLVVKTEFRFMKAAYHDHWKLLS
jgi:hypothetical protein